MTVVLVLLLVAAIVAGSVWLARHVRHPENMPSRSDERADSTSERFYTDPGRPAGPDAEDPVLPPDP
ncbi:MAG TPA: hypothetical protein VGO60_14010 [Iamia sp.]|jgi:hypothetical protein|nr:hypothetical protein [Iamia sp.]